MTFCKLVSGRFTGLDGVAVPGARRDSLGLLSVALEQQPEWRRCRDEQRGLRRWGYEGDLQPASALLPPRCYPAIRRLGVAAS